jgi:hypothetical protein
LATEQVVELVVEPAPVARGLALYRVNAGGPAVLGSPNWQADSSVSPSSYRVSSGQGTYSTSSPIHVNHPSLPAGTPSALFQTERPDGAGGEEMQWEFPVDPGQYEVRLYFAEIYPGAMKQGGRLFDVRIEDQLILDDYDVYAEVGGYAGVMKSFIITADSRLDIDFFHVVENPAIKAIEVLGPVVGWSVESEYMRDALVTGTDGNIYRAVQDVAIGIQPVEDTLEQYWQIAKILQPTVLTVFSDGLGRSNFDYLWDSVKAVVVSADLSINFVSQHYTFDHSINL